MLFSKKDLQKLIIPLMFEQLLAVSVGMVDTLMVSQAGEAAISGVALVDNINRLIIQVMAALATGGAVVCSQFVVTQAVLENRMGGKRTFLGFFDPSVRPWFEADILSFTIPMSRFRVMYDTMRESCLFGTPAWAKVMERINRVKIAD